MKLLDNLITMSYVVIALFIVSYHLIKIDEDLKIPKYYNMKCIVIKEGHYPSIVNFTVPKSFVVIQPLKDTNLITTLNSINFPGFVDFKYKSGDTLFFEFIRKTRFRKK